MDNKEFNVLKLDMLFKIFGIRVTDHEENTIVYDPPRTFGCYAFSQYRKDIEITILKKREEWFHPTPYDMNEIFEEVVHILENVDNHDMFYISSERWATLDNRRAFARTLERRANEFLKECRYLPDFGKFTIEEYSGEFDCAHRIRICMKNDRALQYTMNNKELGQGYYGRLVFVLLRLFEDALKVQEEIDKEKQEKGEKNIEKEEKDRLLMIRILNPTHYSNMFGLVGRIVFEVLPNINLDDKACVTSKTLLNSLINTIQSNELVPDIDIMALERNINTEFKRYYNRFKSCWIETNSFTGNYLLNVRFQGLSFNRSIDSDLLYSQIIYILEELVFRANEMEATAEMKAKIQLDSNACVVMHRGKGYGKSLAQLKMIDDLLKNGVSKIQIAPGKKLENLHNDMLDTLRYLYDSSFMKDCTTAMAQYCKADADAIMRFYLAMKENNKQVVLEQLEEMDDPLVPMKQFESLITGSPNGEAEILIDVNKEDKTMMIPVIRRPQIKKVIFSDPATIVFWEDGTKTVVKCEEGEKFDPEKGVAIALAKKVLYSKDYSRLISSSETVKKIAAKKKAEDKKKAPAKKKPMPKLPVNANVTKTSTVKKTTKRTK